MGRATAVIAQAKQVNDATVEGEVEAMDFRPDHIDADTWELMQENGRMATERLNEILLSPKFMRLKPSDQARFIKLAQDRAFGVPVTHKVDNTGRGGKFNDVTAATLRQLVDRTSLPEYQGSTLTVDIDDAEEL